MPYIFLALSTTSLLLISCSFGGTLEERQERAEQIIEQTTESLVGGIEGAKLLQKEIAENISETSRKITETTTELKKRAEVIQQGIEKIADAVESGQEGIESVRGALNVSGTEEEVIE